MDVLYLLTTETRFEKFKNIISRMDYKPNIIVEKKYTKGKRLDIKLEFNTNGLLLEFCRNYNNEYGEHFILKCL